MAKFNVTKNAMEITTRLDFVLPNQTGVDLRQIEDREKRRNDIIKAFSPRLVEVIRARQKACLKQLLKYQDNIVFNDGLHIEYKRCDESIGNFSVPSYEAMDQAVRLLEDGYYDEYLRNYMMIDQTIKSLLNYPDLPHDDLKGYKFSQLVTILCECLIFSVKN